MNPCCVGCVHANDPGSVKHPWPYVHAGDMICTRFPDWQMVRADHFCGEYGARDDDY